MISSNNHYAMVHHIETALFQEPLLYKTIRHFVVDKIPPSAYDNIINKSCLVVTLGSEALEATLTHRITAPILSVLIRKFIFKQLMEKHFRSLDDKQFPMAVLYIDQPLERQLNLIPVLFPHISPPLRVGILLSKHSLGYQSTLQQLALQKYFHPMMVLLNPTDNPIEQLNILSKNVDVVLAIPDPSIYHNHSVRGILLTAFHKQTPIIGYSNAFVSNGALAAIYSSTQQIGEQTALNITTILKHSMETVPIEQYPHHYRVAINYQVAKSLGLSLPDEQSILHTLETLENATDQESTT